MPPPSRPPSEHAEDVRTYYEQNTRRFLSRGQGGREGAIHRAVWGEGVRHRRAAFHFVHELVWREASSLGRPLRVLDLGCGVGACLQYLAERAPIDGLGITISPIQVALARERARTHATGASLAFQEGNFEALPPMAPVDVAVAIESFLHCADANRFLAEVAAVVRPGGRLIICDDFRAAGAAAPGDAERARLDEFARGWHAATLETVPTIDHLARRHGWELQRDLDLSPHLELGRWRDHLIAPLVRLGRLAGTRGTYFQSLAGGTALQRCLRDGLLQYRFVVWQRGSAPAPPRR